MTIRYASRLDKVLADGAMRLIQSGDLDSAATELERACAMQNENLLCWRLLAQVHRMRRQDAKCCAAYETAARNAICAAAAVDTSIKNSANQTGLSIPSGYSGPACKITRFAADSFRHAALAEARQEHWVRVTHLCDLGLELDLDNPDLHFRKAQALINLDRTSDAIPWFQNCVRLDPQRADAWLGISGTIAYRSCCENSLAGMRTAAEAAQRSLEINPQCTVGRKIIRLSRFFVVLDNILIAIGFTR